MEGVGKTAVMNAYVEGTPLVSEYMPTLGVDMKIKRLGRNTKVRFWDTSGDKRFNAVTRTYFSDTDIVIFFYDATCLESLYYIEDCYRDLLQSRFLDISTAVVATKIDQGRSVPMHMVRRTFCGPHYEVSAKTDVAGVSVALNRIIKAYGDKNALDLGDEDVIRLGPFTRTCSLECCH